MEKRYQVFVSSTYEDLKAERFEIMQTLLELDCIPSGMELFPAADDDQWSVIKKVIDDCDYYIIVIGGKYGSTNKKGISYTELEYDYALAKNKPIISFLIKDPSILPSYRTEQDYERREKLTLFRKKVQKKLCKFWETPDGLASIVSTSLHHLKKTKPGIGWVKADVLQKEEITFQLKKDIDKYNEISSVGIVKVYENMGNFGAQADWIELIANAKKRVDIQGRTLYGWTKSKIIEKLIIDKVKRDRVQFRWLIMDTNNTYLKNLTEEDHGIGDMLIEKATATKDFLFNIKNKLPQKYKEKFEIRFFLHIPLYCSIIRVDEDYYVSNYLYSSPSNDSPMMHLSSQTKAWPQLYQKEFDAIWANSKSTVEKT